MFLLKGLYMDLLRLTSSELQCYGSNSKGTRDIGEGTELPGIRMKTGGEDSFLPGRSAGRGHCSIAEPCPPPPVKAGRW